MNSLLYKESTKNIWLQLDLDTSIIYFSICDHHLKLGMNNGILQLSA